MGQKSSRTAMLTRRRNNSRCVDRASNAVPIKTNWRNTGTTRHLPLFAAYSLVQAPPKAL